MDSRPPLLEPKKIGVGIRIIDQSMTDFLTAPPIDTPLPIIYQDQHLLIVHKPSGLLSVPGRGPEKQDCLINRLLPDYPNARIVHRLDQATSGLIIIALSYESQRALSQLFERRSVGKAYRARVGGLVKEDRGSVNLPLICDWPNRPRQMVDHTNGKPAETHFEVLARDPDTDSTLVELTPITGRSHQLRVHMLELGHPILGDNLYAPPHYRGAAERLLLQAYSLRFIHPMTTEELRLVCEPDF